MDRSVLFFDFEKLINKKIHIKVKIFLITRENQTNPGGGGCFLKIQTDKRYILINAVDLNFPILLLSYCNKRLRE